MPPVAGVAGDFHVLEAEAGQQVTDEELEVSGVHIGEQGPETFFGVGVMACNGTAEGIGGGGETEQPPPVVAEPWCLARGGSPLYVGVELGSHRGLRGRSLWRPRGHQPPRVP